MVAALKRFLKGELPVLARMAIESSEFACQFAKSHHFGATQLSVSNQTIDSGEKV